MARLKFLLLILLGFLATTSNANVDTLQHKINTYFAQGKFQDAKEYITTNLESAYKKEEVNLLNYQLVKVLFIQSDYDKALKTAFNSLDKVGNKHEEVKFNFMIGCIYSAISDYGKSVEYFEEVTRFSIDSSLTVQTQLLLSELHLELQDSVKALKVLTDAHELSKNSSLDKKMKDHVSMQYNFHSQNYELCKEQNFKILKDTSSFLNAQTFAYSMIGECLIKQDSLEQASKYLDEFLKLTFKTKDPEQIKIAAQKLIDINEKLGHQEKANSYHKIYNEAENDTMSFSIEKYRELYNVEKNREASISQSNFVKNYVILISSFLVLIGLLLYFYLKSKNSVQPISFEEEKIPSKKINISDKELSKISYSVDNFISNKKYLTPNITRKSFCKLNDIKSERYLSHYINQKFDKSFSVFLSDLRIEYAYDRIQSDGVFRNYRIEEIAKASGFGSKKSFERVFSAKYGISPFKFISSITD